MSEMIKFENVSKKYRIYYGNKSARNEFYDFFRNILNKESQNKTEYTAIDTISFSIPKGTTLGLIGSNGSGKSTLLKLITKVTYPTSGNIKINGTVASLLEVGAGFHIEFTGRENIYLNGALLGLTRKQIDEKFDEIVDFSELRQFIDTPIKKYSSGMYVKLGFAIAIHVNPEILLVDEVLSVGDSNFQNKCIKKMREIVTDSNKTVILVSHNIVTIQALCDKVLWIEKGHLIALGDTNEVINMYSKEVNKRKFNDKDNDDRLMKSDIYTSEISTFDFNNKKRDEFYNIDKKIIIRLKYNILREIKDNVIINIFLDSIDLGMTILSFSTKNNIEINQSIGEHILKCYFDLSNIYPREISIRVEIKSQDMLASYDSWDDAHRIIIRDSDENINISNTANIIKTEFNFEYE